MMTETPGNTGLGPVPKINGPIGTGALRDRSPSPPPYKGDRGRDRPKIQPWQAEKRALTRRQAKPRTCTRCGAETLTGDNTDWCSITITVDLEPASWLAEIAARLDGRHSAELIHGELHERHPHHLHKPATHPVHLEHHCTPTGRTLF